MPLSQQFMEIEPEMLAMETIVPVYFAVEDDALLSIYEQTQAASASQGSASAAEGGLVGGCCRAEGAWMGCAVLFLGLPFSSQHTLNRGGTGHHGSHLAAATRREESSRTRD